MKKEVGEVSPYGFVATTLGILSLALALSQPFASFVCAVVCLVFSSKEKKEGNSSWARISKLLGLIGLIGSILVFVLGLLLVLNASKNPELLSQLGNLS